MRIDVTVFPAYPGADGDTLDLYYTADARNPSWQFLTRIPTTRSYELEVLSATYTLPAGPLQAVRGAFTFNSASGTCVQSTGSIPVNERDDLVFAVGP